MIMLLFRIISKAYTLWNEIIEPDSGYLACGDTGKGKMPSPEVLEWYILREIAKKRI